jgi:hypothetical protein
MNMTTVRSQAVIQMIGGMESGDYVAATGRYADAPAETGS